MRSERKERASEALERDGSPVESETPVTVAPSAPLSTGPLQYDVLDDDDWED